MRIGSQSTISSAEEYWREFPDKHAEAYESAIKHRAIEADLYWKRAAYLWTIIAAAFAGYFAVEGHDRELIQGAVACLGFIFAIAWHLVSRSSAYWHATWDAHVGMLEDKTVGPLHKVTLDQSVFPVYRFWLPFRFSVSRVHSILSLYVVAIWVFLLIRSLSIVGHKEEPFVGFNLLVLLLITSVFGRLILLLPYVGSFHQGDRMVRVDPPLRSIPSNTANQPQTVEKGVAGGMETPKMQVIEEEDARKNIFYGAVVQAWVDSRMERDRTVLSLSAGGLGILVTLLTAFGPFSKWQLLVFGVATICFLVATALGLLILQRNGPYLEELAKAKPSEITLKRLERNLRRLDRGLYVMFMIGVVLALTAAIICTIFNGGDHR